MFGYGTILQNKLSRRIGNFDFNKILNEYDDSDIEKFIKEKPALHRYPSRMANYIVLWMI